MNPRNSYVKLEKIVQDDNMSSKGLILKLDSNTELGKVVATGDRGSDNLFPNMKVLYDPNSNKVFEYEGYVYITEEDIIAYE